MKYYICSDGKEFDFLMKHFHNNYNIEHFHITKDTKVWNIVSVDDDFGFCTYGLIEKNAQFIRI